MGSGMTGQKAKKIRLQPVMSGCFIFALSVVNSHIY